MTIKLHHIKVQFLVEDTQLFKLKLRYLVVETGYPEHISTFPLQQHFVLGQFMLRGQLQYPKPSSKHR